MFSRKHKADFPKNLLALFPWSDRLCQVFQPKGIFTLPDREVHTIRELIFYQYAKIIAKSAIKTGDVWCVRT